MNLKKQNGAFNELTQRLKEKERIRLCLTKSEKNKIMKAAETVGQLKAKACLMMASVKITDLNKQQERIQKQKDEFENPSKSQAS